MFVWVSRYKRTPCEWPNVILKLWAVICCYNSPHSSGKTPCKSISEVSRHPVLDPVGVRALSRPHHLSVLYKPCANHCLKHESVLMWYAILKVYLGLGTKNMVRVWQRPEFEVLGWGLKNDLTCDSICPHSWASQVKSRVASSRIASPESSHSESADSWHRHDDDDLIWSMDHQVASRGAWLTG